MFVVTKSASCATHDAISLRLYSDFEADYDIVQGTEADWQEVQLRWAPDDAGPDYPPEESFATVYRKTGPAEVAEELASMLEDLEGVEPHTGAKWVAEYLRDVRTIYAFTPHGGDDETLAALRAVIIGIQNEADGLFYADLEGWSNQDHYQITWEFSDRHHEGEWWVAVLDENGEWRPYWIELSDPDDQRAFREGRVLEGRDDEDEDEDEESGDEEPDRQN
jgi:hypothetical protein